MDIANFSLNTFFAELPAKLAIATSGGADSMCLSLLTKKWALKHGIEVICLIVDHKLRPEAAEEAHSTAKFLTDQGIESHILNWLGDKPTSNIQQKAREARYALLCDWCKLNDVQYLLVAHNMEDQAETVLMRIMRGSGVDGLAGIPSITTRNNITIIRPLLNYCRPQILATLHKHNWPYVEDPSNSNVNFTRVRIRQLLKQIDVDGLLKQRLNLLANNMQRSSRFIKNYVNINLKYIAYLQSLGYITILINEFSELDEEVALRVLVKVLNYFSGKQYPPRLENLLNLYQKIKSGQCFHSTFAGCEVLCTESVVNFWREPAAIDSKSTAMQEILRGEEFLWDNRFKLSVVNNNYFVRATSQKDWSTLKSHTHNLPKFPHTRIIYATPVICNQHGEMIAHPLFGFYSEDMQQNISISSVDF